jgi:hypothetical protein
LGASVDVDTYTEVVVNGTNVPTTGGPIASASGGSGNYDYNWSFQSGSANLIVIDGNTDSPTFQSTGTNQLNEAVYRVTVTDNVTAEVIDIDVTVIINNGDTAMLHYLTAENPGASFEVDQGTAGGTWNVNDSVVQRLPGPDGNYFDVITPQANPIRKNPSSGAVTYTVSFWMRMIGTEVVVGNGSGLEAQFMGFHCDWSTRGTFIRLQTNAVGRARLLVSMGNFTSYTTAALGTNDRFIDDNWHHVGFTYNDTTKESKLYENGQLIDTRTSITNYVPDQVPAEIQLLGRNRAQESPSNIDLDEFRYTNRDLSESEMLIEYTRRADLFQP